MVDAGLPTTQFVDQAGEGGNSEDTSSSWPPALGKSNTLRNLAIGGGLAVAAYLAYSLLLPPKRSAPVQGLSRLFKRTRKHSRKHRR